MIKQQNTEQKRNQSHNLQVHLDFSFDSLQRKTTTANNRQSAPGCFERSSGAAEPGSTQRWQCHLVLTTGRYHCLESLDCVLCNQLACSMVILQLITWAVNSGHLCLNTQKKYRPPPTPAQSWKSLSSNSQAVFNSPTTELLRTKSKIEKDSKSISCYSQRTSFGGKLCDISQWHAHFTTVPLSLISFPSPPLGLQPEKGASNKE